MPATVRTEVVGVRDTIRALNKIQPGLRKEFASKATRIAAPAIDEAQASYRRQYLSGMARQWRVRGRRLFPYDIGRARRGVRINLDTRRNALAVINIQQADPGTAVFESAGRRTRNALGTALGPLERNHTRVLGPSVYRKRREITSEMARLVRVTMDRVQREV